MINFRYRFDFAIKPVAFLLAIIGFLFFSVAHAADDDFLDPELAFKFSARMIDTSHAEVRFVIADGYYMYRERFAFKAIGAKLGKAEIPAGKIKFDETFQKNVETYRQSVTIKIPVEGNGPFKLIVSAQGCADKGLCYAPIDYTASLKASGGQAAGDPANADTPRNGLLTAVNDAKSALAANETTEVASAKPSENSTKLADASAAVKRDDSELGRIQATLMSGKFLLILPLFFLLGLGLSFTPCVLPMVPILSSIIVGEGASARGSRGFLLALSYALGMALVYTSFGVAAGLIGEGLAATLQNPWVLGSFALLMVVLSLSMFDVYHLQMPPAIQARLMRASDQQRAGKFVGVFVMGAISALIVGPCVAAPLAGVLVYISQTRDVFIGGGALFAMAAGMSVPLLLVGVSAGTLLPHAGAWMEGVKRFFGVLMLGVAWWMLAALLPGWAQMLGWAGLGIGYGSYLMSRAGSAWVARSVGLVFTILGAVQLVGAASGGNEVTAPFAHIGGQPRAHTSFQRIKTSAQLDNAITNAGGRIVMLDFYADWCVACKEMEKFTFTNPKVEQRLSNMLLLQADVTANNDDDKALLKRFGLFGPPGILFFGPDGKEIHATRVIGFQSAEKFLRSLDATKSPAG